MQVTVKRSGAKGDFVRSVRIVDADIDVNPDFLFAWTSVSLLSLWAELRRSNEPILIASSRIEC